MTDTKTAELTKTMQLQGASMRSHQHWCLRWINEKKTIKCVKLVPITDLLVGKLFKSYEIYINE